MIGQLFLLSALHFLQLVLRISCYIKQFPLYGILIRSHRLFPWQCLDIYIYKIDLQTSYIYIYIYIYRKSASRFYIYIYLSIVMETSDESGWECHTRETVWYNTKFSELTVRNARPTKGITVLSQIFLYVHHFRLFLLYKNIIVIIIIIILISILQKIRRKLDNTLSWTWNSNRYVEITTDLQIQYGWEIS